MGLWLERSSNASAAVTGSSTDNLWPVALKKEGADRLVIEWNDGHRSIYSWRHLRDQCPCAGCREEKTKVADPFRILSASELAPRPPLAPVSMEPAGSYAYKIAWNDGHDTGIFTLEHLRGLCQCAECVKKKL
jgi:DUF971 family protein